MGLDVSAASTLLELIAATLVHHQQGVADGVSIAEHRAKMAAVHEALRQTCCLALNGCLVMPDRITFCSQGLVVIKAQQSQDGQHSQHHAHQYDMLQRLYVPSVACDCKGCCCCTGAYGHTGQASTEHEGVHLGSGACETTWLACAKFCNTYLASAEAMHQYDAWV